MLFLNFSGGSRGSAGEAVSQRDIGRASLHRAVDRLPRLESQREMVRPNVALVDQRALGPLRDTEVW